MIIEQALVTFENGDMLRMELSAVSFGHDENGRPTINSKITITYGEKMKGRCGKDGHFPGESYFMATGTQDFDANEKAKAYDVFVKRSLSTKPYEAIDHG